MLISGIRFEISIKIICGMAEILQYWILQSCKCGQGLEVRLSRKYYTLKRTFFRKIKLLDLYYPWSVFTEIFLMYASLKDFRSPLFIFATAIFKYDPNVVITGAQTTNSVLTQSLSLN